MAKFTIGSEKSSDNPLTMFRELREKFGHKGTVIGVVIIALALGFLAIDNFVLKGDLVASKTLDLDEKDYLAVNVTKPGEDYFVTIWTTGSKEHRLTYYALDPDGIEVYGKSELTSHDGKRSFSFEADRKGEYRIFVEWKSLLGGFAPGARVRVFVNDKRVLSRITNKFRL